MQKLSISLAGLICFLFPAIALSQAIPSGASVRYSVQISNGPPGSCACFSLQGASGDLFWKLGPQPGAALSLSVDLGVEHTGNLNGAGYGLTLSTFTAGPQIALPRIKRVHPFAHALFGVAHGSGSEFPKNGALTDSANSFAFLTGGGADFHLNGLISLRLAQVDYLRTSLPNNVNDSQNNLRVGGGVVFRFIR
jgi:outer membrane immunogenic protein